MASTHDGGPFLVFSELPVGTWFTHRPRVDDSYLWRKVTSARAFCENLMSIHPVLSDQPVEVAYVRIQTDPGVNLFEMKK